MDPPELLRYNAKKLRCYQVGCRFATWDDEAFHHHSETTHVECSCGRWIVEPSYGRHAARDLDCHPADSIGG